MDLFTNHILSFLVFLPLVGGLLLAFISEQKKSLIKTVSLSSSLLTFLISCYMVCGFTPDASLQFQEKVMWIPSLGISYFLAIDGLSLTLVLLTTFITPLVILYAGDQEKSLRAFMMLLLTLETAMLGTFLALDLVLFYVFWEAMLIPMYFLIGVWGGDNKLYATVKFLLYTIFGSFFMLVALIVIVMMYYKQNGIYTTDILSLYGLKFGKYELWLFLGFALAFLIKVPLFPFHTWLPDAHVEAPTEGSVILAAILLKMGVYGLFRFALPLFPNAVITCAPTIITLAIIGIIYGAMLAWAQEDLKKLVAYSSVSHLGYAILGLFALNHEGVTGSLIQLISHGLATGSLFFIVGMIYKRTHTKKLAELGGLAGNCPRLLFCFLIATLASIGLPLTSGFVGEFLSLLGAFREFVAKNLFFATAGILGVLLGAIYMLNMFQKVMFGKPKFQNIKDLTVKEMIVLLPLLIMIIVIGVYPKILKNKVENSIDHLVKNAYKYSLNIKR